MERKQKWVITGVVCVVLGVLVTAWFAADLSRCTYRESSQTYSPDKKFYTQMQFTICQDETKSRVRLVMGEAGKQEKAVLLDLGPSIGTVNLSWHEGPELHVVAPESAITKRYGPYDDLPPVVINP